jgi:hypothetical protein
VAKILGHIPSKSKTTTAAQGGGTMSLDEQTPTEPARTPPRVPAVLSFGRRRGGGGNGGGGNGFSRGTGGRKRETPASDMAVEQ